MKRKKLGFVLAAAGALLALSSLAAAAIPDGGGVVHGCYDKQSGQLRVTDTATNQPKGCSSKELALNWNQQGPQGVPGAQGPKGDSGVSRVFTAGPSTHTIGAAWTPILSLDLPAGQYVVSATLTAHADGPNVGLTTVDCGLSVDDGFTSLAGYASGTVASDAAGDDVLVSSLSLNSHTTRVWWGPGTAILQCSSPNPARAKSAQIVATQVDELK